MSKGVYTWQIVEPQIILDEANSRKSLKPVVLATTYSLE
jgi:hypothetical protein